MKWHFSSVTTYNPDELESEWNKIFRDSPRTINAFPYKCQRCNTTIIGIFCRYSNKRLDGQDLCDECLVKETMES
jgi:hypothetical protein